jgi:hypothetical protein
VRDCSWLLRASGRRVLRDTLEAVLREYDSAKLTTFAGNPLAVLDLEQAGYEAAGKACQAAGSSESQRYIPTSLQSNDTSRTATYCGPQAVAKNRKRLKRRPRCRSPRRTPTRSPLGQRCRSLPPTLTMSLLRLLRSPPRQRGRSPPRTPTMSPLRLLRSVQKLQMALHAKAKPFSPGICTSVTRHDVSRTCLGQGRLQFSSELVGRTLKGR